MHNKQPMYCNTHSVQTIKVEVSSSTGWTEKLQRERSNMKKHMQAIDDRQISIHEIQLDWPPWAELCQRWRSASLKHSVGFLNCCQCCQRDQRVQSWKRQRRKKGVSWQYQSGVILLFFFQHWSKPTVCLITVHHPFCLRVLLPSCLPLWHSF